MKNGKGVLTTGPSNSFAGSDFSSYTPDFRITSGRNSSSRSSLYSPGGGQPILGKQNSVDSTSDRFKNSDGFMSSDGFKSELKGTRRLMAKQGSGMDYSGGTQPFMQRKSGTIEHGSFTEKKPSGNNIRRPKFDGATIPKYALPKIAPKGNNVLPPIAGTSGIGMGSYQPSVISSMKPSGRRVRQTQREQPLTDSVNRPPLYK